MAHRASLKMVLRIVFLYVFVISSFSGFSQILYPILDQNPANVHFKQINVKSNPVRIIYPEGADSLAFLTARSLFTQMPDAEILAKNLTHKWSILLQNQGLNSNGFISLYAPRGEFYTTPSQDASLQATNHWLTLLSAHEIRHIYQNELATSGISRIFKFLWGSNGQGLYSNLLIPHWVWEGDAIETETRLNNQVGRSNIPQFSNVLNAYLWQFGVPNYSKLMAKNYRENVPNHYVFGQFITHKLSKDYGLDEIGHIWQKTLNKPRLFSFSNQIKNKSGFSIDQFVGNILKNQLDTLKQAVGHAKYSVISPINSKGFSSYDYPQKISNGKVIAIKMAFQEIPSLVEIENARERKLCLLGPVYPSNMLSASDQFVVWSEIKYHPRWTQKQSTKLVFFDLGNHQKYDWSNNQKWICPSISPDSKYVSFIELQNNGSSTLKIHDRETKELIDTLRYDASTQIIQPRISTGGLISFILLNSGRKKILVYDFLQKKMIAVRDFGSTNIASTFLYNDHVYFNLPLAKVDQIARWNYKDQSIDYITQSQFGAYSISFSPVSKEPFVFSNYTAKGNQICLGNLSESYPVNLTDIRMEVAPAIASAINQQNLEVSSYSRWNLINPYAWGPLVNSQFNKLDIGLLSKNLNNTLQLGLGYIYDVNEQTGSKYLRASYQGWFPVIDFSFQQGARNTSLYIDKRSPLDSLRSDQWNQTKMDIGVRIPLLLTQGAFQEQLYLSSTYSMFQVDGYNLPLRYKSEAFDGTYSSMIHQINYSKLLFKSHWDLQSRLGYQLNMYWNGMPFKQSLQAELWGFQARIYLPGFFKNHGFLLKASYQQEMKGNYNFNSPFIFTRGFLYGVNQRWTNLSLDYKFPIANTSIKLGRLLYFTRFKGNMFVDVGKGVPNATKLDVYKFYESIGLDISSNFHVLRFSQGFELGVRFLFKPQLNQFEIYPLVLDLGF
jgi:hypothetical protein